MGLTNFPNGVTSFGIPVFGGLPPTFGDVYFVDYRNGSDDDDGKTPESAVKLLSTAYGLCTTNNNDIILIDGDSAIVETEMITWSKNRIHVYGCDGAGHLGVGHGARITMGVTTAATDLAPVKVTGVRNTFTNCKFESTNTKAESLYGHIEAGEFTTYNRCSFIKITDLDQTSAADIVAEGDGTTWCDCEFGAATILTSVARHTMLVDKIVGSTGMYDNNFKDCNFIAYTSDADKNFVKVVAAGDGQRYAMFRGCAFINWDLAAGGTTMTNAVAAPAGSELQMVFDSNTIVVGCTNFAAAANNVGVHICAAVPTAATSGIAVNAA